MRTEQKTTMILSFGKNGRIKGNAYSSKFGTLNVSGTFPRNRPRKTW